MPCSSRGNLAVFFSDSSGGKHPQQDTSKPEEECESTDPGDKGAMAPPPPPNRDVAVDTSAVTVAGDDLVTIISAPPLASAEHVSFCSLLSVVGCAQVLPMRVAPESICDLAQSGMDSELSALTSFL